MYNVKTALLEVGGLSKPSKMPSYAYSLPAKECKVGSKLRKVKGSVCFGCYALKGNYVYPNVQKALYKRLELMKTNTLNHKLITKLDIVMQGLTELYSGGEQTGIANKTLEAIKQLDLPQDSLEEE